MTPTCVPSLTVASQGLADIITTSDNARQVERTPQFQSQIPVPPCDEYLGKSFDSRKHPLSDRSPSPETTKRFNTQSTPSNLQSSSQSASEESMDLKAKSGVKKSEQIEDEEINVYDAFEDIHDYNNYIAETTEDDNYDYRDYEQEMIEKHGYDYEDHDHEEDEEDENGSHYDDEDLEEDQEEAQDDCVEEEEEEEEDEEEDEDEDQYGWEDSDNDSDNDEEDEDDDVVGISWMTKSNTTITIRKDLDSSLVAELAVYLRQNNGCKIPFNDLPSADPSNDQGKVLMIPPNSYRYRIPWTCSTGDSVGCDQVVKLLRQEIREWLQEHGRNLPNFTSSLMVHVFEILPHRYADIRWSNDPAIPCLQMSSRGAIQLKVEGYPAIYVGRGPIKGPCHITIEVTLKPQSDLLLFKKKIELNLMRKIQVIDIWRIRLCDTINGDSQLTGRIVMLVSLLDPRNSPQPSMDPIGAAADLPGYFYFDGDSVHLQYAARRPWCYYCREDATFFHRRDQCARAPCKTCKGKEHTHPKCPSNPENIAKKEEKISRGVLPRPLMQEFHPP